MMQSNLNVEEKERAEFAYLINHQNSLCVIRFRGVIDGKSAKILQACLEEVKSLSCHLFIIDFSKVSRVEATGHRELVQLQKDLRADEVSNKVLLCGLKATLKSSLSDNGIIRSQEVTSDLKQAITNLKATVG